MNGYYRSCDGREEKVIIVHHPHEFLWGSHCGEGGGLGDGLDLRRRWVGAVWEYLVAVELGPGSIGGTLVEANKIVVLKMLEDLAYVGVVLLCVFGEDKAVVHVAGVDAEVPQDAIHQMFEGCLGCLPSNMGRSPWSS